MIKNIHLYQQAAQKLGLDCRELSYISGIEVKVSNNRYYFRGGDTPFNNTSAIGVTDNKYCFNKILASEKFPVPKAVGITERAFENGDYSLEDLKFPLVVKPTVGTSCGKDVICNIKDEPTLLKFLKLGFIKYSCMSVEEFHRGLKSFRVLVFFGDVIGVVERIPANIVCDGEHTIAELIDITNKKRESIKDKVALGIIDPDDPEIAIKLNEMNLSLESIPKKNKRIILCYKCNSTCGGAMHSWGYQICTENRELLVRAAKILSLDLVGFDVLCEDINIPFDKSKGVIIEGNHNPDINIHEHPMSGKPIKVSEIIVEKLIQKNWFACFKHYLKVSNFNKHIYIKAGGVVLVILVLKEALSALS